MVGLHGRSRTGECCGIVLTVLVTKGVSIGYGICLYPSSGVVVGNSGILIPNS